MKKLDNLKAAVEAAVESYENVKEAISTANERVNVAAQLFSMGEVDKDVLATAVEARDVIKASKSDAWDKVVVASMAYEKLKKSTERDSKVKDLMKRLKELSK